MPLVQQVHFQLILPLKSHQSGQVTLSSNLIIRKVFASGGATKMSQCTVLILQPQLACEPPPRESPATQALLLSFQG